MAFVNYNRIAREIIFNPPATIVYWWDDTKTVVKATLDDEYDPITGFAMAYLKKTAEDNDLSYGGSIRAIRKEYEKQMAVKRDKTKKEQQKRLKKTTFKSSDTSTTSLEETKVAFSSALLSFAHIVDLFESGYTEIPND